MLVTNLHIFLCQKKSFENVTFLTLPFLNVQRFLQVLIYNKIGIYGKRNCTLKS